MRLIVAVAIAALTSVAVSQTVNFRVMVQGREIGTATLGMKLTPKVGLTTTFRMKLKAGPNSLSMIAEDFTKLDGMLVWSRMEQGSQEGTLKVREDYGRDGVLVKRTEPNGKSVTKTVKYPAKGSVKSPSDFWFLTSRPKPGAVETSYSFSSSEMTWKQRTTKYLGPKTIIVQGRSVQGHLITSAEADQWVDAKGIPLRIVLKEEGIEIVLERA